MRTITDNVSLLINDYHTLQRRTARSLDQMRGRVGRSCRPALSEVETLSGSLMKLAGLHDNLASFALEVAPQMADTQVVDLAANQLITIIEEAQTQKDVAFLERAASGLTRLVAVRGTDDDYDARLRPYRERAESLLAQVSSGQDPLNVLDEEERKEVESLCTLADAICVASFETEEGKRLLDAVGPLFPWQVQQGLYLRKFCVGDLSVNVEEGNGSEGPSVGTDAQEVALTELTVPVGEDAQGETATEVFELPDVAGEEDSEPTCGGMDEGVVETGDTETLIVSDESEEVRATLEADDTVLFAEPQKIPVKVNVGEVRRELLRRAPVAVSVVLPIVSLFEVVTGQSVWCLHHFYGRPCSFEEVVDALKYLHLMGAVSVFDDGELLYFSMTSYGCALVQKKGISGLRRGRECYWAMPLHQSCVAHDKTIGRSLCRSRCERGLLAFHVLAFFSCERLERAGFDFRQRLVFDEDRVYARVRKGGRTLNFLACWKEQLDEVRDYPYILVLDSVDGPDEYGHRGTEIGCGLFVPKDDPLFEGNEDVCMVTSDLFSPRSDQLEAAGDVAEDDADVVCDTKEAEPAIADDAEASSKTHTTDETIGRIAALGLTLPSGTRDQCDGTEEDSETAVAVVDDGGHELAEAPAPVCFDASEDTEISPAYVEQVVVPSDKEFVALAHHMLAHPEAGVTETGDNGSLAVALCLLECACALGGNSRSESLLAQVRLACGRVDDLDECSSKVLDRLFGEPGQAYGSLYVASVVRALFAPSSPFDYDLIERGKALIASFGEACPSYPELKSLLERLVEVREALPQDGFTLEVLEGLSSSEDRSGRLEQLRRAARALEKKPVVKAKLNGMPLFIDACFGVGSELYRSLESVRFDRRDDLALVEGVLRRFRGADGQISVDLVADEVDAMWAHIVVSRNIKSVRKLALLAHRQVVDAFVARLQVLGEWVSFAGDESSAEDEAVLSSGRADLLDLVHGCQRRLPDTACAMGHDAIVRFLLSDLELRLSSGRALHIIFDEFVLTGYVSLDGDRQPAFPDGSSTLRYFEPWRQVLRHWVAPKPGLRRAAELVLTEGTPACDNLRQRAHLEELLGKPVSKEPIEVACQRAHRVAEGESLRFREALKVACAFGQIDASERESIEAALGRVGAQIIGQREFGLFGQLIAALVREVEDASMGHGKRLFSWMGRLLDQADDQESLELLVCARHEVDQTHDYTVAEDYLSRFEAGERSLSITGETGHGDFAAFVSDEVLKPLFDECQRNRGRSLSGFGGAYVALHAPASWTDEEKQDAQVIVEAWPSHVSTAPDVERLCRALGLAVEGVRVVDAASEHYVAELGQGPVASLDGCPCVVGSRGPSVLHVVVLHGMLSATDVTDAVRGLGHIRIALLIVDGYLSLATRRQIAEICHTTEPRLAPALVVDQVLALHLALTKGDVRRDVLLRCTLPFTCYQPFCDVDGACGQTLFVGREDELASVCGRDGAAIVCGGHTIGKTALFERARRVFRVIGDFDRCALLSVRDCASESAFVSLVIAGVTEQTGLDLGRPRTLKGLTRALRRCLGENGTSLLVLVDDADAFLEAMGTFGAESLKCLLGLRGQNADAFKFVFACLHRPLKMEGHVLGLGPLKPAESLQLVANTLSDVGFDVEGYPHLAWVGSYTNHLPALLHYVGHELVASIGKQYGRYLAASRNNPPYPLATEQIGYLFAERDLDAGIRTRVLEMLGADPRYLAIARCLALLTYEGTDATEAALPSFAAADVAENARSFGLSCLGKEGKAQLSSLMDEMVTMGILASAGDKKQVWRIRTQHLLALIGSADEILDAFVRDSQEVGR